MDARHGGATGEPRDLSWSRTVPRELVHRVSVAEVLLTDVLRVDEEHFAAAACWPRSHPTFPVDGPALHHPLLVVETLRQLGIFIPLRHFGVPADARLLITDLLFTSEPADQPRVGHGATEVTCRVRVTGVRTDGEGTVTALRLDVRFLAGGVPFARAGGGARFLSPERYAAVRRPLAPPRHRRTHVQRPDPAMLGLAHARDLVVGLIGGPGQAGPEDPHRPAPPRSLVVDAADPLHPFFFDHPSDHVPGVVLLEAARQAAALASGGTLLRPTGGRLAAPHFTEFSPAARIVCVPHHRTCVFRIEQLGQRCAFGVLHYASPHRV
ncbi:A-factor biosynthesis protein [Streptomyces sp. LP11]|uniref:A-factor biosynthesis protein n=1 Tax=Streptomyces pyxinicus TaxID=2970331 RepID=A0ABT2B4F4_9ACTN|nr:ScbA/BarX family gamma-butyrolactone biosynthesis protein [Streptomyces sp. LP11]MCS0603389.1 A-factor biosynthesis protein [Streptomyces sp. LP11]